MTKIECFKIRKGRVGRTFKITKITLNKCKNQKEIIKLNNQGFDVFTVITKENKSSLRVHTPTSRNRKMDILLSHINYFEKR